MALSTQVIKASAIPATAGTHVHGRARTASGGAGQYIEVQLKLGGGDSLTEYRVPSNIETAAFTAAVNATWEDENLVTLLNAATVSDIQTSKSVHLFGVLEIITANAVAHTVLWGDGDSVALGDKVQQYTTPAVYAEVKAVFTNTTPVDAYRGAGRPEATFLVERIVDKAAPVDDIIAEVITEVEKAYTKLAVKSVTRTVRIADIRDEVPAAAPFVTAALVALADRDGVHIREEAHRAILTDRDRDAAIELGGTPRHNLLILK